jgi:cell division protein FtsW
MLAGGVLVWLGSHVIINIGAMTGLLPLTGITLPFLSFGGSSLIMMLAILGIAYQLSGSNFRRSQ